MTAAARLVLAALVLLACAARAGEKAPPPPKAPPAAAAAAVAKPTRLSGTVEFRRAADSAFAALALETQLFKGDEVRTGQKSSAELTLVDDSRLTLGEASSLVLREVRGKGPADRTLLDLDEGQLGLSVEKLGERQRFEISTPVAVCGVRGTRLALGHINPKGGRTDKDRGKTILTVGAGLVNAECRNPKFAGQGVNVGKSQSVTITWDGIGKVRGVKVQTFKALMQDLPGWHPDPTDPELAKLQAAAPRNRDGWWNRGRGQGPGAFDRGDRGFSNAAESAILGSLGLGDKAGRGRGQGAGDAFDPLTLATEPAPTVLVGSGSYTTTEVVPGGPTAGPPVTITVVHHYGR